MFIGGAMSVVYAVGMVAWFAVYQAKWQSWGAVGDALNLIWYSG